MSHLGARLVAALALETRRLDYLLRACALTLADGQTVYGWTRGAIDAALNEEET